MAEGQCGIVKKPFPRSVVAKVFTCNWKIRILAFISPSPGSTASTSDLNVQPGCASGRMGCHGQATCPLKKNMFTHVGGTYS